MAYNMYEQQDIERVMSFIDTFHSPNGTKRGSLSAASKEFNIPESTLRGWVKAHGAHKRPGRPSLLTEEESKVVMSFIDACGDHGVICTKRMIRNFVRKNKHLTVCKLSIRII